MTAPVTKTPSVPLATLYERVGHDGRKYLIGRFANARVIIVQTNERSHGDIVWQAVIANGPNPPSDATALAQRLDEGKVQFIERVAS